MKTRIITAAVGVAFVVMLMIFGESTPFLYSIVLGLANAVACMEFLTARKLQKSPLVMLTTLAYALVTPMIAVTRFWYLPVYIYALLMFAYMIFLRLTLNLKDITFGFAGVFVISSAFLVMSRLVVCSGGWYSFFFVISVVAPWCADSAAYFTGSFMGKRKLCPAISPHKTVEGAIGGVFGSVAGAMISGLVFQFIVYDNIRINFGALMIIGLFCAVVSVIGDLVFSVVKRDCGIKDYGSLMPGHGGLLDRVDSVIFCVPFVYFISRSWGLLSVQL
ncbi:MAG: phosphatidate cytidylyltransferase [Ruminococcus sp.]|nr:phosphatidate cytidylyltransferase [Ruminococcus sp.]